MFAAHPFPNPSPSPFPLLPRIHILLVLIGPFLSIMLPAGVVDSKVSKAFEAFFNRPCVPSLTGVWYTGDISSDLSPLKRWAEDLNPQASTLSTLGSSTRPLWGKNWMHEANRVLLQVHRNLRAIRLRFPEHAVDNLLQQANRILDWETRQFALDLIDSSDLKDRHNAHLGVDEVHRKKGVLQHLPYKARVVDGDWWETSGTYNAAPEWCLHVPDYMCLGLFTSSEKQVLQGLPHPTFPCCLRFPHKSCRIDLWSGMTRCGSSASGFARASCLLRTSQWYTIVTATWEQAPKQRDAIWDLVSNKHSRECCWANPKVPRRLGTRARKPPMLMGRETCKRGTELSSAQWPMMRKLHPTAWSPLAVREGWEASATREDEGKQTWHTDVDRLPSTLPRRGDLPTHLSMMLVLSDKNHVDMHEGRLFGEHDGLVRRMVVCDRGDKLLFASIIRHRGVPALPGVGKQWSSYASLPPTKGSSWC